MTTETKKATRTAESRVKPKTPAATSASSSSQLTEELRAYLKAQGADLVGFAGVDRLEGAPEIQRPQRYLPSVRSMISLAVRVNEAVCDLIETHARRDTTPPSYHSFQLHTLVAINEQLDKLAYQGAKFLEQRGYRAYPFPANLPHILNPTPEYPGGPGDVSHKHIAVACGLGQIGWHSLLITPQFKTRQKLVSIATNAPLVPDPMLEEVQCDPVACGVYCAKVCPTKAIPEDTSKRVSCVVGGKTVEYGKLEGWKCRWGCSGMLKSVGGYKDIPMPDEEPSEEDLFSAKCQVDPWQQRMTNFVGLVPYCGRCYTVCCGTSTCGLH